MADSKATLNQSLITASTCMRVKYRQTDEFGKCIRQMLQAVGIGVHRGNRGGVYPAGVRCQTLLQEILEVGFSKEDVNHACVAVEEPPVEWALAHHNQGPLSDQFVTASAYNAYKSRQDPLLDSCFQRPYDDVRHTLLSHNHMLCILRAFNAKAKWDLPAVKDLECCDKGGRLSIAAVAAHANGRELAEILTEGLDCEILSYKMDIEEPTAASMISAALNLPNSMAMRTTELTAIALLNGEIIVQLGKDIGQKVAFQTVRDRLRQQLPNAADDPDLAEIFDYLMSNREDRNIFISDLMDWTSTFVDGSKRQLRFSAFAVVNKVHERAVWSKIAIIKRAYRTKPNNGFCPSPESAWGKLDWNDLQPLEDLLRFFHVSCKLLVDKEAPREQHEIMGNIDIAATTAFYNAKDSKLKHGPEKIKELLLLAVHKYMKQLKLDQMPCLQQPRSELQESVAADMDVQFPGKADWIIWKTGAAVVNVKGAEATTSPLSSTAAVCAIKFDAVTGAKLTTQVDFSKNDTKAIPRKLPWRQWREETTLGLIESDKAAVVTVLADLHHVDCEHITIWEANGKAAVKVDRKVTKGQVLLAPCIPKQCKVLVDSVHPHAVHINLMVPRRTDEIEEAATPAQVIEDNSKISREKKFRVNPEWHHPKRVTSTSRSRGAPVTSRSRGAPDAEVPEVSEESEWEWDPEGKNTMNPFWAVKRMTEKEMQQQSPEKGQMRSRFNCELVVNKMSVVSCVNTGAVARSLFRLIDIPFLTNNEDLEEGEELILKIEEPEKKKDEKKRTWRDQQREDDNKAKVAKQAKQGVKKQAPAGQ